MFRSLRLHSLCLGFHIVFFLIYVALNIVWISKGNTIVFDVPKGNNVSIILSSILQLCVTGSCAVLLFFTKCVSIRQNLLRRQPLTVTHDITAAWGGLGSAVFSLCKQFSVAASIRRVWEVAAYLTCISILHIAAPTLITLRLFNASSPLVVPTTLAFPNATADDFTMVYANTELGSEVPLWSRLQSSTPGLMGSTIFDVLQVSSGKGTTVVVATTFDVTCGSVQGQFLPVSQLNRTENPVDTRTPTFFVDQTGHALIGIHDVAGPYTLNTSGSLMGSSSNQIILTSTYNFSDSRGVVESVFPLPSALNMTEFNSGKAYDIDLLQVIGCTLSVSDEFVFVDVQSGNIVKAPDPAKRSSRWTPFVVDNLNSTDHSFVVAWPWMFSASPGINDIYNTNMWCRTPTGNCTVVSAIDSTIMRLLGLPPFAEPPVPEQLTLHMLEDVIANTTALIFWFFARYTESGPMDLASRQPNSPYLSLSETIVGQDKLVFGLYFNVVQLLVSTLMALILLLLAEELTSGGGEATPINDVGFLQTLWLSHQHPDLTRFVSEIDKPSAAELRKRGMTTAVRLAAQVCEDSTESTGLVLRQFSNDSESHIQSLSSSRTDLRLNSQDEQIYGPTTPATTRMNETSAT